MKRFISCSGGVESTTMCILYGADAIGICCDTGSEHDKMIERLKELESKVKAIHHTFQLIIIKPSVTAKGQTVHSLEDYIRIYKVMPSGQMRFCTREFKIKPIDDFLAQQGECELMIGFNYDEQGRTGNLGLKANVKYTYPLIEDGLTRQDCEEILRQHNLHPNFPVYMMRGGCRMCFFKSEKEYRAMYHLAHDEFKEVQEFEESIQDKRKKFYSIMGNGKSLRQLASECENEKAFMQGQDWNELYKSLRKETSCGAFCHR